MTYIGSLIYELATAGYTDGIWLSATLTMLGCSLLLLIAGIVLVVLVKIAAWLYGGFNDLRELIARR